MMIGSRTWAFQRTHYWTSKIQDGWDPPSWILTPKCKNAIFSKKLSNLELWCLLMTYRKLYQRNLAFQRTIIGPLKSKMAEIRHLENRHDIILFCRGWSDLDKISETGAEWQVDCGDMIEIKTRYRISIWRTFGWIQWHVIPEPRITLQGATTWWIHCHDSRATCHIAGCKNSVRRTENPFSPYFIIIFFVFNAV